MRLLRSASLVLGVLLVAGASVAACSAKHDPAPGEILLAIDANLNVPSDMDQLGVSVMAEDGTVASIDQVYPMAPIGDAKFPATLAIVRGTSGPVDIKVAGFKGGEAFVLRETVTTLPTDRTAILRIDLNWLDEGSTSGTGTQVQALTTAMPCVAGQTSVAGTCEPFTLDSATLPTYANGALVSTSATDTDAGVECLDIVDCVVGQPGATIPPQSAQPIVGSVVGADGGMLPTCVMTPPTFGGDFNIGMVPKSGAAGWCNGAGCALPLENPVAPNWPVASDGMVHLPLGVCTSTKIAGLLLSPVTRGCPQYSATSHPACQSYGMDGGITTFTGDGSVRTSDGGDGGKGITYVVPDTIGAGLTGADETFTTFVGMVVDPTSTSDAGDTAYTFRRTPTDGGSAVDAGTELDSVQFTNVPFFYGTLTPYVINYDLHSPTFAVTADRVAVGSVFGVNVFSLADGSNVGSYSTSIIGSPISVGFDKQGLLVAAGFNSALSWFRPDGGSGTNPTFTDGQPFLLAFNNAENDFVVLSKATSPQQNDELRTLDFEQSGGPEAATLPAPFVSVAHNTIAAIAVADATTVVWVTFDGTFSVATIDGDAGAGTPLGVNQTLYVDNTVGAPVLAGGGGRIAWIDSQNHVWSMRVGMGAAQGAPTDLSSLANNEHGLFFNATTVALSPAANFLHWTQSDTHTTYMTRISDLPP